MNFLLHIKGVEDKLKKTMNRITNNSMYSSNDLQIIEAIARLQANNFLKALKSTCEISRKDLNVITQNVQKDFLSFKANSLILWKKTHDYDEHIVELTASEIDSYNQYIVSVQDLSRYGKMRVCL